MPQTSDMAAFDRLPKAVRARLAASRFDLPAAAVAADKREHGLSAAETVALVGELEGWAAAAEATAVRGEGNRLSPASPPRIDEMVDRIRGNAFR